MPAQDKALILSSVSCSEMGRAWGVQDCLLLASWLLIQTQVGTEGGESLLLCPWLLRLQAALWFCTWRILSPASSCLWFIRRGCDLCLKPQPPVQPARLLCPRPWSQSIHSEIMPN